MLDSACVAVGWQQGELEEAFASFLEGDHEKREDDCSGDFQEVAGSVLVKNLEVEAGAKKVVEELLARFAWH